MKFSKYYLAAILSFVIWGFFSLAVNPIKTYASLDILFYRVFICAVIMAFISLVIRRRVLLTNVAVYRCMPASQRIKIATLTCGGGFLLTANWFFFIYVMNHISIKAASFAYLVCPILTTVMAFFILKEKLSKWQWAAVVLSVVSCLLLSFNSLADVGYSMIVALSYALYLISQRKNTGIDKFTILTVQLIFAGMLLLPFYPAFSEAVPTDPTFWVSISIIAVMLTIVPLYLNLYALQGVTSSTMGILLYINPLINFAIALFYFYESINEIQTVAYALILFSIVVFNEQYIFSKREKTVLG
jgi:chloramphenicol-sensitive protein RarD